MLMEELREEQERVIGILFIVFGIVFSVMGFLVGFAVGRLDAPSSHFDTTVENTSEKIDRVERFTE